MINLPFDPCLSLGLDLNSGDNDIVLNNTAERVSPCRRNSRLYIQARYKNWKAIEPFLSNTAYSPQLWSDRQKSDLGICAGFQALQYAHAYAQGDYDTHL